MPNFKQGAPTRWLKKSRASKAPVLAKNVLSAMRAEQVLLEVEGHPHHREECVLTDLSGLNDE